MLEIVNNYDYVAFDDLVHGFHDAVMTELKIFTSARVDHAGMMWDDTAPYTAQCLFHSQFEECRTIFCAFENVSTCRLSFLCSNASVGIVGGGGFSLPDSQMTSEKYGLSSEIVRYSIYAGNGRDPATSISELTGSICLDWVESFRTLGLALSWDVVLAGALGSDALRRQINLAQVSSYAMTLLAGQVTDPIANEIAGASQLSEAELIGLIERRRLNGGNENVMRKWRAVCFDERLRNLPSSQRGIASALTGFWLSWPEAADVIHLKSELTYSGVSDSVCIERVVKGYREWLQKECLQLSDRP